MSEPNKICSICGRDHDTSYHERRLVYDCLPFANRHRWRNKRSGPHWSLILRFVKLFDYACLMESVLMDIAEDAGVTKNADWARRKALEALARGELKGEVKG